MDRGRQWKNSEPLGKATTGNELNRKSVPSFTEILSYVYIEEKQEKQDG